MDSPNIIRVPMPPGLTVMQQITGKANLAAAMKEAGYSQAAIATVLKAHEQRELPAWQDFHRRIMTEALAMRVTPTHEESRRC